MKIAKAMIVGPQRNQAYGLLALMLSFFVFAYSTRFGPISILLYYGFWLPLVLVDYKRVLGRYSRYGWIFAFAIVCFLSSFWSAAPATSLRASIQYLTHIVCALIAVRVLAPQTLSRGAMIGCFVVLLYSLMAGSYHYDPLDGSYSFVGAFSSKNQLGFYASLGVLFTFTTCFIFPASGIWRLLAAGVGLVSGYSLFASQSATSVITTLAVLFVAGAMQIIVRVSPRQRRVLFIAGLFIGVGAAAFVLQSGAMNAVLGAFGKDTTLTGRTYLWQQGMVAAGNAPWLGVGYQGYWVPGFPDAERLWDDFFIASRSGFHFHNTYIETMVETGLLGTLLLVLVLVRTAAGHFGRLLLLNRSTEAGLLFPVITLLIIRSFVEIDVMHPYHVGSFLLYFAAGRLTLVQRQPSLAPNAIPARQARPYDRLRPIPLGSG
ncbi:exopolysaccharide production protein ExoQ [Pseudorhizobium tarimense]|uniref:Exopolysaccharide production protein ExoQ n=1 Tax=Pseudorhizobium tarimense TaxID=1079109 RepID=A0ABV2H1F2_9HYPH|nr:O-antigen ligase [Pseudorhizobium tarimense]MCJ8517479.1 O-antigen ligase family protein [Pseudorhizobium tarimense]